MGVSTLARRVKIKKEAKPAFGGGLESYGTEVLLYSPATAFRFALMVHAVRPPPTVR